MHWATCLCLSSKSIALLPCYLKMVLLVFFRQINKKTKNKKRLNDDVLFPSHLNTSLYLTVLVHDGQYGLHAAVFHQVRLVAHQDQRNPEYTITHMQKSTCLLCTVVFFPPRKAVTHFAVKISNNTKGRTRPNLLFHRSSLLTEKHLTDIVHPLLPNHFQLKYLALAP